MVDMLYSRDCAEVKYVPHVGRAGMFLFALFRDFNLNSKMPLGKYGILALFFNVNFNSPRKLRIRNTKLILRETVQISDVELTQFSI